MSRTERLLDLLQLLRRHRSPVSGAALASELGVSLRSLYRDIATLRGQWAGIEGEPGLGYVLRPGFTLPPLMFSVEELEALVLGSRWVALRSDDRGLATAGRDALAKIAAVLPDELRREIEAATLLVGPEAPHIDTVDAGLVREAIRRERKPHGLRIHLRGRRSRRPPPPPVRPRRRSALTDRAARGVWALTSGRWWDLRVPSSARTSGPSRRSPRPSRYRRARS
jgi:biotin operon repressor